MCNFVRFHYQLIYKVFLNPSYAPHLIYLELIRTDRDPTVYQPRFCPSSNGSVAFKIHSRRLQWHLEFFCRLLALAKPQECIARLPVGYVSLPQSDVWWLVSVAFFVVLSRLMERFRQVLQDTLHKWLSGTRGCSASVEEIRCWTPPSALPCKDWPATNSSSARQCTTYHGTPLAKSKSARRPRLLYPQR